MIAWALAVALAGEPERVPAEQGLPPAEAPVEQAPTLIPEVEPLPVEAPIEPSPPEPPKKKSKVTFRATGHVKSFGLATFPYPSDLLPSEPSGQGIADARLALTLGVGKVFRFEIAHAITPTLGASGSSLSLGRTGVGVTGNETVRLSWTAFGDGTFKLAGRTDRLVFRLKLPHVDLSIGRQPVTFGTGMFFTPLDLVNPFTPTTIDTEVKPGVDAVRVDGYVGTSTKITAVAAYVGDPSTYDPEAAYAKDWSTRALAFAAHGQATVGVTDLSLLYGYIHRDHVIGVSVATSAGPVALHGDAALTVADPDSDDGVYFRGVLGASGLVTPKTSLSGELYVQTLGTTQADQLLAQLTGPRYQRSELWLGGVGYYAVALDQEIVPVLHGAVAVIGSLTEASLLLTPSIRWSIADNADLGLGGFVGIGKRPSTDVDALTLLQTGGLRSEFGTYPGVVFLQLRSWF
jgi:hypothetical protein